MTISAIIAIYKPPVERLNRCLAAVLPQVDEVVVAGDQDTPWPIVGLMQDEKIRLVRHPRNETGYGKKANMGVTRSFGDVLWFLNDDCFAGSDLAEKCMAEMRDGVAVVTHTLRFPDGSIQYSGYCRHANRRGFTHRDYHQAQSRHTQPVEQEAGCGASMFVRRSAFLEVGGFDPIFRLYSEDADLGLRLRQKGWKVIFTPLAEGIHEEHKSVEITPRWKAHWRKSQKIFEHRWADYFRKNPDPNKLGTFR